MAVLGEVAREAGLDEDEVVEPECLQWLMESPLLLSRTTMGATWRATSGQSTTSTRQLLKKALVLAMQGMLPKCVLGKALPAAMT